MSISSQNIRLTVNSVLITIILSSITEHCLCNLSDATRSVWGNNTSGVIAAFGDFNSDKLTDVFVLKYSDSVDVLQVFLAFNDEPLLRPSNIKCDIKGITSVVPGDFDGDSMMDVLITTSEKNDNIMQYKILWGSLNDMDCKTSLVSGPMKGQPLIMDYNGDRIPDVFLQTVNGESEVHLMSLHRNKTEIKFPGTGTGSEIKIPNSSAFVDMNSDNTADLVITTQNGLEIFTSQEMGEYNLTHEIPWPTAKMIGQITILDIDLNGKMDIIVPVCYDDLCTNSSINILSNYTWAPIFSSFQTSNAKWKFFPPSSTSSRDVAMEATTLRVGDYDGDGYPDLICILKSQVAKTKQIFLFRNVPCGSCVGKRSFEILWDNQIFTDNKDAQLAAFYDIYNDGKLDILVVKEKDQTWEMEAYLNYFSNDACFIKVIVLSGLCYHNCPSGITPYGVNQPGPSVCYRTTMHDGSQLFSCAAQLSQTAHFSLQLPYTIFGLGQTPNFVDNLVVGIPHPPNDTARQHEWTAIIPNSQMYVIPYLESAGYKWYAKLFVTPSHLVLLTFAALVGTMGFIAFIIIGLHWKEKIEDKKEKLQEAHRFHFDAL